MAVNVLPALQPAVLVHEQREVGQVNRQLLLQPDRALAGAHHLAQALFVEALEAPFLTGLPVVAGKNARAGDVPLELLFAGTVFTRGETGFGVEQIPWSCEARYRMPVAVWRRTPGEAWLGQLPFFAWRRFSHVACASVAASG